MVPFQVVTFCFCLCNRLADIGEVLKKSMAAVSAAAEAVAAAAAREAAAADGGAKDRKVTCYTVVRCKGGGDGLLASGS